MMDWIEADPLPAACLNCQKEDCYNCDTAGERWELSREDELRVRRKQLAKAIERLQRKINAIDMELLPFTAEQRTALNGHIEMTYDLFWECLQVCFDILLIRPRVTTAIALRQYHNYSNPPLGNPCMPLGLDWLLSIP